MALRVWICGLAALLAQAQPPDPSLLPRIREHMQQRLSEVPNYTCQETVERAERRSHQSAFHVLDTMLLEVAQVSGRELLAWPGGRFEARPLSSFASSGLMANGAFAMHARGLFIGDRATWKYAGESSEDGRKLLRFAFSVPISKSGYRVRSGSAAAVIPYHGFLLADAETLDAVRIEIFSDKIAKEIGMERADMTIEYQRVRIGTTDALLPKSAAITTILRATKTRQRNRIAFTGCRQYGADSEISFIAPRDAPPPAEKALSPAGGPEVALPPQARLALRLAAVLDSAQTPVGTPIQAILDEDVTDGARLLVPKGARIWGRVRKLERKEASGPAFEIGLEFTRAEWDGGSAQFTAALEEVAPDASAQLTLSSFVDESLEPSAIGTFYVRGDVLSLPAGFRTVWTVLAGTEQRR